LVRSLITVNSNSANVSRALAIAWCCGSRVCVVYATVGNNAPHLQ
jgi:hypothetical protein